MQILIGLALSIAVIVAVFAWQNPALVSIRFLGWKFDGSIAFICSAIFAMGFVTNFLFSMASIIRYRWLVYKQKKRIDLLEQKLNEKDQRPTFDIPERNQ